MSGDEFACDTIRSSSSSFIRGPSWSCGIGGDQQRLSQTRSQSASGTTLDSNSANDPSGRPEVNNTPRQRASQSLCEPQPSRNNQATCQSRIWIQIPTVYLTKKRPENLAHVNDGLLSSSVPTTITSSSSHSYHTYQIAIRSENGPCWSVYRRYSQFYTLHHSVKSLLPKLSKSLKLPPKKRLYSKSSNIVQERRVKLENYLNDLIGYLDQFALPIYELPSRNPSPSPTMESMMTGISQRPNASSSTNTSDNNNTSSKSSDPLTSDDDDLVEDAETDMNSERMHDYTASVDSGSQRDSNDGIIHHHGRTRSSNSSGRLADDIVSSQDTQSQQSPSESHLEAQIKVRNLLYQFISFHNKRDEPAPNMAHPPTDGVS